MIAMHRLRFLVPVALAAVGLVACGGSTQGLAQQAPAATVASAAPKTLPATV